MHLNANVNMTKNAFFITVMLCKSVIDVYTVKAVLQFEITVFCFNIFLNVIYSCTAMMAQWIFSSQYSSFQYHTIIQKSFYTEINKEI